METLHAMRLFWRAMQDGSFSEVGRNVGLSAASVSRQISALEDHLGVQLLNRSSRKLNLTEAGMVFHQRLGHILSDLQDATETVANFQARPRGTLRLHARAAIGILLITPHLPRFLAQYPELKVDLSVTNSASVDLADRNIDIDIRVGRLDDSSLIAKRLASSDSIVCCAPNYLKDRKTPRTPADLADHNCITYYVSPVPPVWRFLDSNGALTEAKIIGNLQSDNGAVILSAALSGLGLIVMPEWAVASEIADGRLVRLMPEYRASVTSFDSGIYAVYQSARLGSPKVRAFVDFMSDLMKTRT